MAQVKKYDSTAERMAAYRQRKRQAEAEAEARRRERVRERTDTANRVRDEARQRLIEQRKFYSEREHISYLDQLIEVLSRVPIYVDQS